jgi:hypothetical protein
VLRGGRREAVLGAESTRQPRNEMGGASSAAMDHRRPLGPGHERTFDPAGSRSCEAWVRDSFWLSHLKLGGACMMEGLLADGYGRGVSTIRKNG